MFFIALSLSMDDCLSLSIEDFLIFSLPHWFADNEILGSLIITYEQYLTLIDCLLSFP